MLYGSSIELRRIWCKEVVVLIESLGERRVDTVLLVPGPDFSSFTAQICVLTHESVLCQFSCSPGQHPHLSTPPPLFFLFAVQVFPYIRLNVQSYSFTEAHFPHPCSYSCSKGLVTPYYSFLSVTI